jgi:translation elongation factor EF-G
MSDELVIRRHEAKTASDAEKLVEGLRDTYNQRDGVTWQYEETNAEGMLYGLGPGGMVYVIAVSPPLTHES